MGTNEQGVVTRVLVTGSAGFIGRHLVRYLRDSGYDVRGVDARSAPPDLLDHSVRLDIMKKDELQKLFHCYQPTVVCHLAAETDPRKNSIRDFAVNVEGTKNLLEAVFRTSSTTRTIFTSSQLVNRLGTSPSDDHEMTPDTAYGESKARMEKVVRERDGGGSVWCIVRPTTVWGPEMGEHYLRAFRLIRRGWYVHSGKSSPVRSLSYVKNLVYQYRALIEVREELVHRHVFYLADDFPYSIREWTDEVARAMNARPIRSVPEPLLRILARCGDLLVQISLPAPLTSFRLKNLTSSSVVDTEPIRMITGPLPYDLSAAASEFAGWLDSRGI